MKRRFKITEEQLKKMVELMNEQTKTEQDKKVVNKTTKNKSK